MLECNTAPFCDINCTVTLPNGSSVTVPLPDCIDEKSFYPTRTSPAVGALLSQSSRYCDLFYIYLTREKVPKEWFRRYLESYITSEISEAFTVAIGAHVIEIGVY